MPHFEAGLDLAHLVLEAAQRLQRAFVITTLSRSSGPLLPRRTTPSVMRNRRPCRPW